MTFLWIVIGLGIVFSVFLVRKYMKTHKYDYVQIDLHCRSCGDVTNGLKCRQCEHEKTSKNY